MAGMLADLYHITTFYSPRYLACMYVTTCLLYYSKSLPLIGLRCH